MADLYCESKRCGRLITEHVIRTTRQHLNAKPDPESGAVTVTHVFLTCSWPCAIAVAEHFRKLDEEGIDDGG